MQYIQISRVTPERTCPWDKELLCRCRENAEVQPFDRWAHCKFEFRAVKEGFGMPMTGQDVEQRIRHLCVPRGLSWIRNTCRPHYSRVRIWPGEAEPWRNLDEDQLVVPYRGGIKFSAHDLWTCNDRSNIPIPTFGICGVCKKVYGPIGWYCINEKCQYTYQHREAIGFVPLMDRQGYFYCGRAFGRLLSMDGVDEVSVSRIWKPDFKLALMIDIEEMSVWVTDTVSRELPDFGPRVHQWWKRWLTSERYHIPDAEEHRPGTKAFNETVAWYERIGSLLRRLESSLGHRVLRDNERREPKPPAVDGTVYPSAMQVLQSMSNVFRYEFQKYAVQTGMKRPKWRGEVIDIDLDD